MANKFYLVTGGTGFIGSALVRRLVHNGHRVRVLDNQSRGSAARLADIQSDFEFVQADIRNPAEVSKAVQGVDSVCHLAFVNGTEFFYSRPGFVLDVGVKGIVNTLDACLEHNVPEFVLASSSEVYQTPPQIPTDESAPLLIPDPLNPRFSYAGGKIISELMALNYGRENFERVLVFRPHNVYGPDMGWEHVIPQLAIRAGEMIQKHPHDEILFPIHGDGTETRAFVHINDFTDGLVTVLDKGEHLNIYHIGNNEEVAIRDLVRLIFDHLNRTCKIVPGELTQGSTRRRCPNISKLASLGYRPRISLAQGLPDVVDWYTTHSKPA